MARQLLEKMQNTNRLRDISRKPLVSNCACEVQSNDFASFLGDLYMSDSNDALTFDPNQLCEIPTFTMDELRTALMKISSNKAADAQGILIEMIKFGSDHLLEYILKCYNEML